MRVPDPRRCAEQSADDEDGLPNPELAPLAADISDRLAVATAHMNAGRDAKALELADDVWQRAQGLGHPPLEIRARNLRARVLVRTGESETAEHELRAVIEDAATHRRNRQEAQAWVSLVAVLGHARHRVDESLSLRIAAEAALHRAGDPADLRADLAHAVATTLLSRGDYEEAIAEFERALELRGATLDEHHPDVARTRGDLGVALVRAGRSEQAEAELVRALQDSEAALGSDHPVIASLAHNLGNVRLEGRGDLDGAAEMFERALRIRERALGRGHPRVAEILVSLSALRRRIGDYDSALATGERAVAILEAPGKPDPKLAHALNGLGVTYLALGRPTDALASHERARALLTALHGEQHASVGRTRVRQCEALGALARFDDAIRECNAALAILARVHEGPHRETSDALRNAAVVHLEAGHRRIALEHARRAVAMDRALNRPTGERAVAEFELLRVLAADPADREEARALRDVVEDALARHDDRVFVDRARAWLRTH